MSTSNWPAGVDRAASNWTGRTQRTSDWGGNWAPDSHRIPASAWVGAAVVVGVFAVFAFVGQVFA